MKSDLKVSSKTPAMKSSNTPSIANPVILGAENAELAFYLPTPPVTTTSWHWQKPDAIEQIIKDNGNHWRKIFTIMAKIAAANDAPDSWRECRDLIFNNSKKLASVPVNFSQCNIIINATELNTHSQVHIICGQEALGKIHDPSFKSAAVAIDDKQKIMAHEQILITPYLDYRQFPNVLIEQLRQYLYKASN
ncbi:DUF6942 family protein [Shewanella donghaensis]|uniref:DUF6942 family protein n=1 Tax=Shewanella donghaensis TaxID=238836 RepID=UPI0011832FA0|nr:hypothetical protein [Shewanella donghaensis]